MNRLNYINNYILYLNQIIVSAQNILSVISVFLIL